MKVKSDVGSAGFSTGHDDVEAATHLDACRYIRPGVDTEKGGMLGSETMRDLGEGRAESTEPLLDEVCRCLFGWNGSQRARWRS